eukprot:TRINITY_DN47591_c0_g1_i1.p1 TRINITY_DN47591_c0_g1~~TRINITY_DN47591_c0_g1_i1.p1  ORF type:complete len:438 (-),score=82.67 TRINITY_DN47591_c0_g1_i1:65-1378(-)
MGCGVSPRCCRGPSPKLDRLAGSQQVEKDAVRDSKFLGPNSSNENEDQNPVNASLGDCKDVGHIEPIPSHNDIVSDHCLERAVEELVDHHAGTSSWDAELSSAAGETPSTASGHVPGTVSSICTHGIAPDDILFNDFEDHNAQEIHEAHLLVTGVCREHACTAAAQESGVPCCNGSGEAAAASDDNATAAGQEDSRTFSPCFPSCVSRSNGTAASMGGQSAVAAALEAVALDSNGVVVIQRQIYAEPQQAYTVIWNEDGSHCAFGQQTISSLLTNDAATTNAWLGLLTHRQLHGLVHEAGQRLEEQRHDYQSRRHSSEQAEVLESYALFGLDPEAASDKDLEAAYRRLAKQLHPDKNGGTEEAKEQFQAMQARHDMLLAHRGRGRATGPGPCHGNVAGGQAPLPEGPIMYDPRDPGSLLAALWQILPKLEFLAQELR